MARVTVPSGWNAWVGPNHFDGHAPGRSNEEALGHATWYVGLLIVELEMVAAGSCDAVLNTVNVSGQGTSAIVRAITNVPRLELTSPAERRTKFGHPAVHLRMEIVPAKAGCDRDFLFSSARAGAVPLLDDGSDIDAWVVDVDGHTTVIWGTWTQNAPPNEVRDLRAMIDSIEFDLEE